jgi:hypothetical protein
VTEIKYFFNFLCLRYKVRRTKFHVRGQRDVRVILSKKRNRKIFDMTLRLILCSLSPKSKPARNFVEQKENVSDMTLRLILCSLSPKSKSGRNFVKQKENVSDMTLRLILCFLSV